MKKIILATFLVAALASLGYGQTEEELARELQNPVADIISLPFQNNVNGGIGPFDRIQDVLNIQPVYPIPAGDVILIDYEVHRAVDIPARRRRRERRDLRFGRR
ncbi:MAG: hypothetical protein PVH29_09925 [Candidatus Zixiibacteriota bacterium]|jgi:hypothetical protein